MNEFDAIYAAGGWDNKGSGPGSTELFTRDFRKVFENLLKERGIKSVFDLGCGDWQWQRHVKWPALKYIGWDVSNVALHDAAETWVHLPDQTRLDLQPEYHQLNAFSQPLWPEADLLIVKDVLHHISAFKARRLALQASFYDYVLWVVDMDAKKVPVNWPFNNISMPLYEFDLTVEDYRYGPKHVFLQDNTHS